MPRPAPAYPGRLPDAVREGPQSLPHTLRLGPLQKRRHLVRHHHRYPDLEVELAFYACRLPDGAAPRALGVAALEWARAGTLAAYDFCEADRPVLPAIEAGPPRAG